MNYRRLLIMLGYPFLIALVGVIAYSNSFEGVFLLDDRSSIIENTRIMQLWPLASILLNDMRPLVQMSFAINYFLGGLAVEGYHLFNLIVHLLTAIILYGLVRRTLRLKSFKETWNKNAQHLALAIALLWVAHPLNTQSVTYIVQRAESLMGMWYLLTIYCVLRAEKSAYPRRWYTTSIVACFVGMACKAVMVTAPIIVLLYDRQFIAGSFRMALKKRKWLYSGFTLSWLLLIFLIMTVPSLNSLTATGVHSKSFSLWQYALSQPGVITHYLKLIIWPQNLIFDYAWPVPQHAFNVIYDLIIFAALIMTAVAVSRKSSKIGFLCASFFIIISPTSSIFQLTDLAAEHRMYLPSIAAITLIVVGMYRFVSKSLVKKKTLQKVIMIGSLSVTTAILSALTFERNKVYSSSLLMWSDVIRKRPENPRAHYNLAFALAKENKNKEAIEHYSMASELNENYLDAYNNLGLTFVKVGQLDNAIQAYESALLINSDSAEVHNNYGLLLLSMGRADEAYGHLKKAVRQNPDNAGVHLNLGNSLLYQGNVEASITEFKIAQRIDPAQVQIYNSLAAAFAAQGKDDLAIKTYKKAISLNPNFAEAFNNVGLSLIHQNQLDEAIIHLSKAITLNPSYAEAHNNLGVAFYHQQRFEEAGKSFKRAIKINPNYQSAVNNLLSLEE